jgi:hypothetical protein
MVFPERFLRVINGAAAVVVASRDAQLRPRAARGSLLRRGEGPDALVVYLLHKMAGHVLPNLRDNGAIAVMVSLTINHEAFQVKGRVLDIRDAPATDEPALRDRLDMFRDDSARLGLPRRLIDQVSHWPAVMITFTATELYHQSPGPGAGERVRA